MEIADSLRYLHRHAMHRMSQQNGFAAVRTALASALASALAPALRVVR